MNTSKAEFLRFFWRITACHMVPYMVVGVAAFIIMDYATSFSAECSNMVPTDSPWVALGPALQVFRGLLFAVVLYPFREVIVSGRWGWLKLWGLFMGLAILGTSGPAPGSLEGMVFTRTPIVDQVVGAWEVVLQTLITSILFVTWYQRPSRAWNVVMGVLVFLTVTMSIGAVLAPQPEIFQAGQGAGG